MMSIVRYRLVAAAALIAIVSAIHSGGAAATLEGRSYKPALPAAEEFVHGIGLRIRLTVRTAALGPFEDPGFTVVFENTGTLPIYLNPFIVPNVHLYDDQGRLVTPTSYWVTESILRSVTKSDLIDLRPGRTWSTPVDPQHYSSEEDAWAAYTVSRAPRQPASFALRGGRYTARFVYFNYPGFAAQYDPYEIRHVWEGRQEAEPVSFSVARGAEHAIERVERAARIARQRTPELTATIDELEQQLMSDERTEVAAAAAQLSRRNSTASVPALLPLLRDPRPWKRYIGVNALRTVGGEEVRDDLRALIDDPEPNVRSSALRHLGNHCDLADLPLFESRLEPTLGEGVMYGIGLCGNAASFAKLRPLLEAGDADVRSRAEHALRLLTFTELTFGEIPPHAQPRHWDAWYRKHRSQSREQWALRRLRTVRRQSSSGSATPFALDYLRRLKDSRHLPQFRIAAASRLYTVRVAAARAIAQFDRAEALVLLRRELQNRHLGACQLAAIELNALTGQRLQFDFKLPSERRRAIEAYATVR